MLLDEGHELIWFDETMLLLYGMVHEDISVGLYFRVKDLTCVVNVGKKPCSGIPRVEDRAREVNTFGTGVKEF